MFINIISEKDVAFVLLSDAFSIFALLIIIKKMNGAGSTLIKATGYHGRRSFYNGSF